MIILISPCRNMYILRQGEISMIIYVYIYIHIYTYMITLISPSRNIYILLFAIYIYIYGKIVAYVKLNAFSTSVFKQIQVFTVVT